MPARLHSPVVNPPDASRAPLILREIKVTQGCAPAPDLEEVITGLPEPVPASS
ncbi:hypothetical protein DFJ66_7542 [Saccharothrix variisporea]|uniref:Uncharacterized protein n=1 Tax=Saccharothrix variisporea TaxID=543527 RepID=A0A495XKJ6_9PSEU|nr:hypothetical protein DFJ66_7542 [Saccharothrix variisporea]